MLKTVKYFKDEYGHLADVTINFEEHLPPFEKVDDKFIPEIFDKAAKNAGVTPDITTFHAGAETHIYANQINSKSNSFIFLDILFISS